MAGGDERRAAAGAALLSSYAASLPFIRGEWGLTNAQSGVVFSAYLAGYAVSSLALVPLTDRFRRSAYW